LRFARGQSAYQIPVLCHPDNHGGLHTPKSLLRDGGAFFIIKPRFTQKHHKEACENNGQIKSGVGMKADGY
jgi:hypothetical protein